VNIFLNSVNWLIFFMDNQRPSGETGRTVMTDFKWLNELSYYSRFSGSCPGISHLKQRCSRFLDFTLQRVGLPFKSSSVFSRKRMACTHTHTHTICPFIQSQTFQWPAEGWILSKIFVWSYYPKFKYSHDKNLKVKMKLLVCLIINR
jgi:hypothetical protein